MKYKFIDRHNFNNYLPEIENLYIESFNSKKGTDYFKWRYLENPYEDIQMIVAFEGDKLASLYAVSPKEILYNNRKIKTAISLNTMTRREYRGRGLFVDLANKLYDRMGDCGYEMVWGYPNNISHRTFIKKLGWKNIYEIPTLEVNRNDLKLSSNEKIDNIKIINDDSFECNYDNLSIDNSKIIINKDSSILKWRYLHNPNNKYYNFCIVDNNRVVSFIVVKIYGKLLNIVDYRYRSIDEFICILRHIITDRKFNNIDKVTLWNGINSDLRSFLEKIGFYNNYPIRYFGGKLLNTKIKKDDFMNWNNWQLNMGDNNEY